jgi:hypothetical protein
MPIIAISKLNWANGKMVTWGKNISNKCVKASFYFGWIAETSTELAFKTNE